MKARKHHWNIPIQRWGRGWLSSLKIHSIQAKIWCLSCFRGIEYFFGHLAHGDKWWTLKWIRCNCKSQWNAQARVRDRVAKLQFSPSTCIVLPWSNSRPTFFFWIVALLDLLAYYPYLKYFCFFMPFRILLWNYPVCLWGHFYSGRTGLKFGYFCQSIADKLTKSKLLPINWNMSPNR